MKTNTLKVLVVTVVAVANVLPVKLGAAQLIAGWDFNTQPSNGEWRSVDDKYTVSIVGDARISAEGRPFVKGPGGSGLDVSAANSGYLLFEGEGADNPINLAAVDDSLSIVFWQKNFSNQNSSTFWSLSESESRQLQVHVPWSNGTIYFDTMGCCENPKQRLYGAPGPPYEWLEQWHHYAFVKDGPIKRIYLDGELLIENEGADPLSLDATRFFIGADSSGQSPDAIIDDFAIFKGVLSDIEILAFTQNIIIETFPEDSDRDGIPDKWEIEWGFDPNNPSDARLDPDQDGDINLVEYQKGTDPLDTTDPILVFASVDCSMDKVTMEFSEALNQITALDKRNYSFDPPLMIQEISYDKKTVTLTTSPQIPASSYLVTVNNVQDLSKNSVPPNSSQKVYTCYEVTDGVLSFEAWFNIPGNSIEGLYDPKVPEPGMDASFPPDFKSGIFSFNSRDAFPDDYHDHYAARMRGFVTPSETGDYHFFTRSDDSSELFISSDENPGKVVKITEELGCCGAFQEPGMGSTTTSEPIRLVAGQKYYIEFRYKEGGGGDYGELAWRMVGDPTPASVLNPIAGLYLSAIEPVLVPSEGAFAGVFPENASKNHMPYTSIRISHYNEAVQWTEDNTRLLVNGHSVEGQFTKTGRLATITYTPASLFPSDKEVTVTLEYPDPVGDPTTEQWSFHVAAYSGPILDSVGSYPGLILGNGRLTKDTEGHTGLKGDRGMDFTIRGGAMVVAEYDFLNNAFERDQLTVVYWGKKHQITSSSAFWIESASAGEGKRGFQAHVPWSNGQIYFDTMGCCAEGTQRLKGPIDSFSGYTDSTFWTENWHLFSFSKNGGQKEIRIDGELFNQSQDALPLVPDVIGFYIGSSNGGMEDLSVFDDFAVFSTALTELDLKSMVAGTSPNQLPQEKGLLAYWDFNDEIGQSPERAIHIAEIRDEEFVMEYTGTLYFSEDVAGPFSILEGATSPYSISPAKSKMFFLVK